MTEDQPCRPLLLSFTQIHFASLVFMLGYCTGIGPKLVAKVLNDPRTRDVARIAVISDVRVLELGMRDAKVPPKYKVVPKVAAIDWAWDAVPEIDLCNIDPARFKQGVVSAESGKLTGDTLAYAIDLAKRGEIDAIIFAPLNKRAMFDGGWKFPDEHFELRRSISSGQQFSRSQPQESIVEDHSR